MLHKEAQNSLWIKAKVKAPFSTSSASGSLDAYRTQSSSRKMRLGLSFLEHIEEISSPESIEISGQPLRIDQLEAYFATSRGNASHATLVLRDVNIFDWTCLGLTGSGVQATRTTSVVNPKSGQIEGYLIGRLVETEAEQASQRSRTTQDTRTPKTEQPKQTAGAVNRKEGERKKVDQDPQRAHVRSQTEDHEIDEQKSPPPEATEPPPTPRDPIADNRRKANQNEKNVKRYRIDWFKKTDVQPPILLEKLPIQLLILAFLWSQTNAETAQIYMSGVLLYWFIALFIRVIPNSPQRELKILMLASAALLLVLGRQEIYDQTCKLVSWGHVLICVISACLLLRYISAKWAQIGLALWLAASYSLYSVCNGNLTGTHHEADQIAISFKQAISRIKDGELPPPPIEPPPVTAIDGSTYASFEGQAKSAIPDPCSATYFFPTVLFGLNQSNVTPYGELSIQAIQSLGESLKNNGGKTHYIFTGHTDSLGDPAYNLVLSRKRAESLRDLLEALGFISLEQVQIRAAGSLIPIDPSNPRMNRRVEIKAICN